MNDADNDIQYIVLAEPFSAHSRAVQLLLGEKSLPFKVQNKSATLQQDDIMALNASGTLPILLEDENGHTQVVSEISAILPYIEETCPYPALYPKSLGLRAEMRRLICWFLDKFTVEVATTLIYERLNAKPTPDPANIRHAMVQLKSHMEYLDWLLGNRHWLAGDSMSHADIMAAAHISLLDYMGDIQWHGYTATKDWYSRMKQRPCFRPLLAETVPGHPPSHWYRDLDF